jgi:hypothetical protein
LPEPKPFQPPIFPPGFETGCEGLITGVCVDGLEILGDGCGTGPEALGLFAFGAGLDTAGCAGLGAVDVGLAVDSLFRLLSSGL